MLILSNNCIAGYIYRDLLKQKYPHPFIWSRMWNDDFLYFIQNLETIDFNKFELKKKTTGFRIPYDWYILIDDALKVEYKHMWFSATDDVPRIRNNEVFYNKIWEYIVGKYETRLKRMELKNPIIFIEDNNNEDVIKMIDVCKNKNYKCFCFTNKLPKCTTENLIIRPHDINTNEPNDYVKKYSKEILEFINHS